MKKSVILLCGLALIALIIGYSYKEPVDEKEAESDQVIDTADQTPTKTTIEETVVTIEDVETEKDEEMPTPTPISSAESEAESVVTEHPVVLDSDTESYYQKGRETRDYGKN